MSKVEKTEAHVAAPGKADHPARTTLFDMPLVPVLNYHAGLAKLAMATRTAKAEAYAAAKAAAAKG